MRAYAEVGGRRLPSLGGPNPLAEISTRPLIAAALAAQGDPRVTVAVLDGPCDTSHPCFRGATLTEFDLLGGGPSRVS